MLLSQKTVVQVNPAYANILGHMCYAASKLWNIGNYERYHYEELKLPQYPDWYYQKSTHKGHLWYKSLPSQSAQEVLKQLDKSWKSFYELKRSGGIENPRPPRYKQDKMAITYMQNAIVHEVGSGQIRLSIPKQLREYMSLTYDIGEKYLFLENKIFQNTDVIKQIKIYPPNEKGKCQMIVIYEVEEIKRLPENGHYLSIDLGLHNLMACYDNESTSFILGREYLAICQYYDKRIALMQSQWAKCQATKGIRYPKPSKHLLRVYQKKKNCVRDYLHKITKYLVNYCKQENITVVVIGDITNIREGKDYGKVTNQKFHSLPYKRIYELLEYKLKRQGIHFIKQNEAYSSQCAPNTPEVSKKYAKKENRQHRGLYVDEDAGMIYNADALGAFNTLRKYFAISGMKKELSISRIKQIEIIKVAV